jgi:two-component system, chemotaxis family, protein-glutamate methylesterase/glutaminase
VSKNVSVLIADDSVFMRYLTAEILKIAGGFDILDFAGNGKDAAEKCLALKPDVVVMDMVMGEYDGIMGVKRIMEQCPTPIVILSALGNTDMTGILHALEIGAVDYHHKPDRSVSNIEEIDRSFVEKIIAASKAQVANGAQTYNVQKSNVLKHTFNGQLNYDVIVIGASTGGPTAIENVLTRLPENLSIPVLIAQHMPPNFVPSFSERLNQLSPLNISMAQKDDELLPGRVLIAPGSRNMVVKATSTASVVCDFTIERFKEYNFPSITGLMNSVAEVYGSRAIGVLLTGMGRDGAQGLKSIKAKGGYTIAQSEKTCVVYGMPKEAVEIEAVNKVVNIDEIAPFIVSCLG